MCMTSAERLFLGWLWLCVAELQERVESRVVVTSPVTRVDSGKAVRINALRQRSGTHHTQFLHPLGILCSLGCRPFCLRRTRANPCKPICHVMGGNPAGHTSGLVWILVLCWICNARGPKSLQSLPQHLPCAGSASETRPLAPVSVDRGPGGAVDILIAAAGQMSVRMSCVWDARARPAQAL